MEPIEHGTLHPLTIVLEQIKTIFAKQGFSIATGPELEDEWHNFDALNVPKDHPSRDMQDTFYIKDKPGFVMRTHTSPVQIRYMKEHTPPFAILAPGKVFRNEATDSTHEAQFHQIEGLVVGEDITLEHLKGTLLSFFKELFGEKTEIRLRPSFFPFVEPGVEVDVKVGEKWLEVCGAGMVHPDVLKAGGIDPQKFSGFAFGVGLDRLGVVKFGVPDVRLFYQGDLRLNQWS
ncbi:MAG TPA: phenylalanine--tRNA ligase subunit alpha [Candidatus Paceibacterota bacterium]|jgi:phenylalanyl-tRNA synthetase alpha chain|nr:phenylalanine--tRNA ligase subunit alpha [Candidatus Paceibacterota bacterium]